MTQTWRSTSCTQDLRSSKVNRQVINCNRMSSRAYTLGRNDRSNKHRVRAVSIKASKKKLCCVEAWTIISTSATSVLQLGPTSVSTPSPHSSFPSFNSAVLNPSPPTQGYLAMFADGILSCPNSAGTTSISKIEARNVGC